MRTKGLVSAMVLLSAVSFLIAGGCGSDDESSKGASGGTSGGKGGSGGSSNGGTSNGGSSTAGVAGEMGSPEPTGSTCTAAADCYMGLDTSLLSGDAACLDSVPDGYCTHECETDDDCCAVEGECRTGFRQVCASFENAGVKYCFLSCEDADLVAAGGAGVGGAASVDATEYCQREANPRFACRSTGGGADNRLVCLPEAGTAGAGGGGNPNGGAGNPNGGAGNPNGGAGGTLGGAGGA
ncbi:MAG TPA: hypothetical protein VGP93_13645 [Polyangiaceae bacterium]|nr:hypothetical protein [Polyangiaceae bacterium]